MEKFLEIIKEFDKRNGKKKGEETLLTIVNEELRVYSWAVVARIYLEDYEYLFGESNEYKEETKQWFKIELEKLIS